MSLKAFVAAVTLSSELVRRVGGHEIIPYLPRDPAIFEGHQHAVVEQMLQPSPARGSCLYSAGTKLFHGIARLVLRGDLGGVGLAAPFVLLRYEHIRLTKTSTVLVAGGLFETR
jgi:hypothetical protein